MTVSTSVKLAEELPEVAILTHATAADWRAAITLAGQALVASGVTTDNYTAEMVAAVEDLGPYIVIAPGLAIAHSRPSSAVLRAGLSWVSLATPVMFGNKKNDPVSLVIGLAAPDHASHLGIMSALALVLADADALSQLTEADSPARVREILAAIDKKSSQDPPLERKAHS
ncbi:PTS sugar transporter subunit IIA [Cryobacterium algoritolerans]|uniref:Ascorbate-specific PTS system EIIA component n=1 Tax=Cryobacterium algoritolerans TaxID=1259184 RepID=A0A4R8WUM5_9MICO|nr:PTS sugar transporter subunit IIA [Cryobacterium algoritolerans]TFC17363.1 PTS sugar transporter subunit IIA [Cryobacterium algoritolerans]